MSVVFGEVRAEHVGLVRDPEGLELTLTAVTAQGLPDLAPLGWQVQGAANVGLADILPTVLQATGLPVVATRHGGISEAVQPGEGGALVEERQRAREAKDFATADRDFSVWYQASGDDRQSAASLRSRRARSD